MKAYICSECDFQWAADSFPEECPRCHKKFGLPADVGCLTGAVLASESDPTGRKAHEAGAKLDAGKVRAGLVLAGFSRALIEVAKVGTYGAQKYSDNGWMEVPNGVDRYTDAMLRHFLKEAAGEQADPDTGLAHAAHMAWNALARLELLMR